MVAHIHAELMAKYAQDALETETPWWGWEYKHNSSSRWLSMSASPSWDAEFSYRRKPTTININGFEVPEPMREEPKERICSWLASIEDGKPRPCLWAGDRIDQSWLAAGLIHATEEAAQLHLDALLSFTRVDK